MIPLHSLTERVEFRSGLVLGGFVCLAIVLLGATWNVTRPAIEAARHQLLLDGLEELLAAGSYDNDPADDRISVSAAALGNAQAHSLYRARNDQRDTAMVIESTAPHGYSGSIRLLVACTRAGKILGVRVTEHRETPGLGDAIEASRSDWILQFDQLSIDRLPLSAWRLQDNDGEFDQISGATITSQAVVSALYRTVAWYKDNAELLFAADRGEKLHFSHAEKRH